MFNTLGTETHLIIRKDRVLRTFDPMLSDVLGEYMREFRIVWEAITDPEEKIGLNLHKNSNVKKVEKTSSGSLLVHVDSLEKPLEVDVLLWAIGRHANTEKLGVDKVGVKLDKKGDVVVNEYQESNVENIYSVGDVAGKELLTPVAIAAGRRLSNRLFGPSKFKNDKLSYFDIPSVVFS